MGLHGIPKSLVVVYRYSHNPSLTKIAPEGNQMSIVKVVLPYVCWPSGHKWLAE